LSNGAKAAPDVLTMAVYPNPVGQRLFISKLGVGAVVTITDVSGKVVAADKGIKGNYVDVSFLKPGTYFVKVVQGDKESVQKFVKR
jgi:hypothetical protein